MDTYSLMILLAVDYICLLYMYIYLYINIKYIYNIYNIYSVKETSSGGGHAFSLAHMGRIGIRMKRQKRKKVFKKYF